MAIAEMPRESRQRGRVGCADLGQRLRRRDHLDDASVLQPQPVAHAQRDGLDKVEKEREPLHAGHGHATSMALVVIEHHGIGGLARPDAGGDNGMRVQHRV